MPAPPASPPETDSNGARSPESLAMQREGPGTSRTKYHTMPLPAEQPTSPSRVQEAHASSLPLPEIPQGDDQAHGINQAPYRPPETVYDAPEDEPPPYTASIVAEPIEDGSMDIDSKEARSPPEDGRTSGEPVLQDFEYDFTGPEWDEPSHPEWDPSGLQYPPAVDVKPQLGPGILPRRWLSVVHEHELVRPFIDDVPPPLKKSAPAPGSAPAESSSAPSGSSNPPVPDCHIASAEDVYRALPGDGVDSEDWYFCTTCWAWLRIAVGRGMPDAVQTMEEWEASVVENKVYPDHDAFEAARAARAEEWSRLNDLMAARLTATEQHFHYQTFTKLVSPSKAARIERVSVPEEMNVFPHITFGVDDVDPTWVKHEAQYSPARLFFSDSADVWMLVGDGLVPGQLPLGLVKGFTQEKMHNPSPGLGGYESVNEAWTLVTTLLINPLFRGQRGWVNLDNKRFLSKIGAGLTSSRILYEIGFACQQETDGLRVGPFKASGDDGEEKKAQMEQMDRYMMRVWVEITLYLLDFQRKIGLHAVNPPYMDAVTLEFSTNDIVGYPKYATGMKDYPDNVREAIHILGATKFDTPGTMEIAYDLQIAFDAKNTAKYLGALEKIAGAPMFGQQSLEMKVALEKSMDKYTEDDLVQAYNLLGYTTAHAEDLSVPAEDAPSHYILDMHKKSVQASTSPYQRADLNKALILIARDRGDEHMRTIGEKGQTVISVVEAYEALSAPRDAVDDGLIMQYEMAVNEYPNKAEHYRMCLSVIADAPGEERPGLKQFLQTGSREPDSPARKDVPVGLHNIGNTCYLNSILQYLYTIRPLREAVITFEQDQSKPTVPSKPDVERAKRFVRQLRFLFLQLYKSELPAVRPEEELAYLAITRPEMDESEETESAPQPAATITEPLSEMVLDDIPSLDATATPHSSTSSAVTSVPRSPTQRADVPDSGLTTPDDEELQISDTSDDADIGVVSPETTSSRETVLGKRANQDRDRSYSRSPGEERVRLKSESSGLGLEGAQDGDVGAVSTSPIKTSPVVAPQALGAAGTGTAESPSMMTATEMSQLELVSPTPEEMMQEDVEESKVSASDGVDAITIAEQPESEVKVDEPSVPPALPPRPKPVKRETLVSGLRFGLQQDSAEVLINVLSQLELALEKPAEEEGKDGSNIIKSLFSCMFKQQIVYESPATSPGGTFTPLYEAQNPVEAVFTHPIIGVEEEGKDLYDCLAELYLKGADIEYENKKGYMMELMDEFPPMLYIQMRRSQYDPETGRERKTNTHISFPQTLSMSRFLLSAPADKREESIELTREMTRIRTKLHTLKNHKPLPIPATFRHAAEGLKNLALSDVEVPELVGVITADLLDGVVDEAGEIEREIEELQQSIPMLKKKMDEIWEDEKRSGEEEVGEYDYELVSVFMHRGRTSGSGHYWTYQAHLPGHDDEFYNYNDEKVTVVPASEVLQDRTGDDANPALLCYARKGWNLIESLHRECMERKLEVQIEEDADEDEVLIELR